MPLPELTLRHHRTGDVAWVIGRQAAIYHEEYGWDGTFEALLADIGATFIRDFDLVRERCWIAELGGERVGAVFLCRQSDEVAKLRMLHVEAGARGHGVGRRLVSACVAFARAAGYRRMVLWTNDILLPARRIYATLGFVLTGSERHHSFGQDLVGETWELDLGG